MHSVHLEGTSATLKKALRLMAASLAASLSGLRYHNIVGPGASITSSRACVQTVAGFTGDSRFFKTLHVCQGRFQSQIRKQSDAGQNQGEVLANSFETSRGAGMERSFIALM